ncbi:MAG: hypothetical protein KatS3mg052_2438 [Candidatus Roseilinea sp.]|nr:MAG: hypothetical protein KatS3mg052_2438 [Candidatus Roseilinea sp.]
MMVAALIFTPLFVLLGLSLWAMFGSEAVVNRVHWYRQRMLTRSAFDEGLRTQPNEQVGLMEGAGQFGPKEQG